MVTDEVSTTVVPIRQLKKSRDKEMKSCAQDHATGIWQTEDQAA